MPGSLCGSARNSMTSLGSLGSFHSYDISDLTKSVPITPTNDYRRTFSFGDLKKDPDTISIGSRLDYDDDDHMAEGVDNTKTLL